MYGMIWPRPAMNLRPTPRWQTTFNSGIIASSKGVSTYGYQRAVGSLPTVGSIADGTIDILSNAQIFTIRRNVGFEFTLSGTHPNSGWEYLFIKDYVLRREFMTYSTPTDGNTTWRTPPLVHPEAPIPTFGETETNIFLGMA